MYPGSRFPNRAGDGRPATYRSSPGAEAFHMTPRRPVGCTCYVNSGHSDWWVLLGPVLTALTGAVLTAPVSAQHFIEVVCTDNVHSARPLASSESDHADTKRLVYWCSVDWWTPGLFRPV